MKTQTIVAVLAVLMFMTAPVMAVTSWAEGIAVANEDGAMVGTAAGSYTDRISVSAGSVAIGDEVYSGSGTEATDSEALAGTEAEGLLVLGGASADVEKESAGVDLESNVEVIAIGGSLNAGAYATDEADAQITAVGASAEGIGVEALASGSAINLDGTSSMEIDAGALLGTVSIEQESTAFGDTGGEEANVAGIAYAAGLAVGTNAEVGAEADNSDDEATVGILAGASGDETSVTIGGSAGGMSAYMTSSATAMGFGAESFTFVVGSAHDIVD